MDGFRNRQFAIVVTQSFDIPFQNHRSLTFESSWMALEIDGLPLSLSHHVSRVNQLN